MLFTTAAINDGIHRHQVTGKFTTYICCNSTDALTNTQLNYLSQKDPSYSLRLTHLIDNFLNIYSK
jgi:hypothetical protein